LDSKGTFVTVKPNDALAAKYISCYYFHVSYDPDFTKRFFFYPNYNHALTIYKGSQTTLTDEGSLVVPSAEDNISSFYTVNVDKNFRVELNGIFNKIGVVFNPLGINHFLGQPLCEVFNSDIAVFNYFGNDFEKVLQQVYDEEDSDKKVSLLDAFFHSRYKGFEEPVVKSAVAEILNSNGSVRVEELSDKLQVNRKTLLRLFKKHLCCSVEEYKKLVMFRNALNYSQQAGESATLTDVALYSLYYDQAHFIKHFKSVAKLPPKQLLSSLTKLGSQEVVYWHFED
jgi:AraC-like DNA-binding protein